MFSRYDKVNIGVDWFWVLVWMVFGWMFDLFFNNLLMMQIVFYILYGMKCENSVMYVLEIW